MINTDTYTGASFSLKNRLGRVVWNVVATVFFKPTPAPLHGWRSFVLRCFGARIGKGAHVYPGVKIWAPWNIEIGDQTGIGSGANLYSQGKITIGRRTVISQGAYLCAGTHDYTKEGFPLVTKPINIGSEVWIAAEAFIHPGVTVADGSVIGARAVVVEDVPAWVVCAGNPCRVLKERKLNK